MPPGLGRRPAIVTSWQADVARLEELQSYEKIYAPFDGVITDAHTDIGDLISAGAGDAQQRTFHIQATGICASMWRSPSLRATKFMSAPNATGRSSPRAPPDH